jgi:glutathione S-transferase
MTLKLYFGAGACSFVPHTLLEVAGAAYEPIAVKLHKQENLGPEYRAINPRGQVPVLVDGDEVITQILAIVTYLDAKFPESHFLPREPLARARVIETLAWMNNTAHPMFTHVFMPFKFAENEEARAEIKRFASAQFAQVLDELEALARKAADAGQPFLAGAHFGPLDPYALTLLRWGGFAGYDPTKYPALWAHAQKLAAMPPVARALERERIQLNVYKAG